MVTLLLINNLHVSWATDVTVFIRMSSSYYLAVSLSLTAFITKCTGCLRVGLQANLAHAHTEEQASLTLKVTSISR